MTTLIVDTDIIYSPHVKAYIKKCDHRIKSGFRLALEALGIAVPDFAARLPSGPKPGQGIIAAFAADAAVHGDNGFTPSGNRRNGDTVAQSHLTAFGRSPPTPQPVTGIAARG